METLKSSREKTRQIRVSTDTKILLHRWVIGFLLGVVFGMLYEVVTKLH